MAFVDAEAWTCPDCSITYRQPRGWEAAVWLAARRAAQVVHASRHGRSALIANRRRATDARPPGELPPEWADPSWAAPVSRDELAQHGRPPVQLTELPEHRRD